MFIERNLIQNSKSWHKANNEYISATKIIFNLTNKESSNSSFSSIHIQQEYVIIKGVKHKIKILLWHWALFFFFFPGLQPGNDYTKKSAYYYCFITNSQSFWNNYMEWFKANVTKEKAQRKVFSGFSGVILPNKKHKK